MKQNRRIFLRNGALTGAAMTIPGFASQGQAPAGSGLHSANSEPDAAASALVRRQFQSPPKKFRPLVRWWWPGNDVTESELRREIDALDEAGFGGAEIQPFVKGFATKDLPLAQAQRLNSYASPSFFRHVAVAADEARKRGMFIDYTFGSGWPFGGGENITPELASVELRSSHISIEGPAKLREPMQIPSVTDGDPSNGSDILKGLPDGWAERMRARSKVVAVVAARGEDAVWYSNLGSSQERTVAKAGRLERNTLVDLTARMQPDGMLHWDVPAGTWQLFVFCSVPTGQRVNAGAGEGPQLVLDHLSSAAFAAHAQRVGGEAIPFLGEFFGNGLRAIFCDSLEVRANLYWCDDFPVEFIRRRGYDLLPYLPILKVQSSDEPFGEYIDRPIFEMEDIGDQVRHDYRQTVSDLMIERFYGQFDKWAHDHTLLARTQAHGSPTDVLRVYGEADIPETETLYDNGGYDFLKMAASAANVYGRSIVGSESFVWSNALYQTTPEKMKLAADELFAAGVNAIVYHGFPYKWPGLPPPGWHPFTGVLSGCYSSQLNELNPFWRYFAQLNCYISRVQYISQTGTNVAAVALYRNDLAHGASEQPPAPKLNQAIMDAGYNYDHINADSLVASTVRDQVLVTAGGARYRVLVFPSIDAIDAKLAEKLHGFASAGLAILFAGQAPLNAQGLLENASKTQSVRAAMRRLREFPHVHFCVGAADAISALKGVANPNIRFHSQALPFIQKRIGSIDTFFVRNESDEMKHVNVEFEAEGRPELWDPCTGQTRVITGYRRKADWVEIDLDLKPLSSALIVFDPGAAKEPALMAAPAAPGLKRTQEIGVGGWKLTATGLVPSGNTAVIQRDLPRLIDWSLDRELRGFSGRGVYTTSFTQSAPGAGNRIVLDLGRIKDVAEVAVNGKSAATLLMRPYEADITSFVHPGENLLEVTVTNALFNCMVLREPRPFRAGPTENPNGLMSSGLIGPVQLKVMT